MSCLRLDPVVASCSSTFAGDGTFARGAAATTCLQCPPSSGTNSTHCKCKGDFYPVDSADEDAGFTCLLCPRALATCSDGTIRNEKDGWLFQASGQPAQVFACPKGYCNDNGQCADGRLPYFNNTLCAQCADGHTEWSGQCVAVICRARFTVACYCSAKRWMAAS